MRRLAITNLQTSGPAGGVSLVFRIAEAILKPIASQDAARGALPKLFAATSIDASPAGYYGPDGFGELKGAPAPAKVNPVANDRALSKRLWQETERLVKSDFAIEQRSAANLETSGQIV